MKPNEFLDELKIDNDAGFGRTPKNTDVDYFGIRVMMKPSTFLSLAAPMTIGPEERAQIEWMKQQDAAGKTFAAPTLHVEVPNEWHDGDLSGARPHVFSHEGRHRMNTQLETVGDVPLETHIFLESPNREWRNRHITPQIIAKLNQGITSQLHRYRAGPLFAMGVTEDEKLPALGTICEWGGSKLRHPDIPMLPHDQEIAAHKKEKPEIFKPNTRKENPHFKALSSYVFGSKVYNDYLHKHYKGIKQGRKDWSVKGKYIHNAELSGTPELVKYIHLLDDLLKSHKLKDDYVLYSGLHSSPAEFWKQLGKPTNKPIVVHLPGYTSTSLNWDEARNHAAQAQVDYTVHIPRNTDAPKKISTEYQQIIKIFAPKGTPGTTAKYSGTTYSGESEILLPRGLTVQIDPRPTVLRGITVWHATIVKHAPLKIEPVTEAIDPRIVDSEGLEDNKTSEATPGITYKAQANGFGHFTISAWHNGKRIGVLPMAASSVASADAGSSFLSAEDGTVVVDPAYRRQGIAQQMYLYAQELGNTVKRASYQTDDGKALWDKKLSNVIKTENTIKIDPPSGKVQQFIDDIYAKYPVNGMNPRQRVVVYGKGEDQQFAMFELTPSSSAKDAVEVKWFQAYPMRQGVGTKAMRELQDAARAAGVKLTLFPWDKGVVSQNSLMRFYRKSGFKPIKKGGKTMQWESQQIDEMISIPCGRKGKATCYAPAMLYHNLRGRPASPDGSIKGYPLDRKERELEDLFAELSPDGYVWLSLDPTYSGNDYLTIDSTKLDPRNLRYTGQSEGFILHRGSIPASAITRRAKK